MGRPVNTEFRARWYERELEAAPDPKAEFEVLRSKLAADVKRLPEELRDGAYQVAVDALRGVIEAVEDAMGSQVSAAVIR
ncbi:hypothetical protein SEA_SATIS_188 [Streptomyces phage Satis]|nr:hypothetical protein SEA_SATIS_188 [Streptomyces phage Satis]QBZ72085.1 hypothetical protein SEA_KRADAL_189 [Streptomyces phage Kradal]QPL14505.1 hypothetical protein SEA_EHYELIMAYOE_190 [Streptomyces phage EhyElimayoE]